MNDDAIQSDLLTAHADALARGEQEYQARYSALFPKEMLTLSPLFEVAEQLYQLFHAPVTMRPEFRRDLKAGLLAEARQQRVSATPRGWSWAAIGAASAVTVAIAAAAWRGHVSRPSR